MDKIEYIKLEITIPKITYQLIKNKMYLPILKTYRARDFSQK